jgi:hypothetical protein
MVIVESLSRHQPRDPFESNQNLRRLSLDPLVEL